MKRRRGFVMGLIVMLAVWPVGLMAQQRYRVAACDWMMLKRQKIGEFKLRLDDAETPENRGV